MVSVCFWYCFGMCWYVLIWFWYGICMVSVWFVYVCWYGFGMVLVRFGTALVWCWYGVGMVLICCGMF